VEQPLATDFEPAIRALQEELAAQRGQRDADQTALAAALAEQAQRAAEAEALRAEMKAGAKAETKKVAAEQATQDDALREVQVQVQGHTDGLAGLKNELKTAMAANGATAKKVADLETMLEKLEGRVDLAGGDGGDASAALLTRLEEVEGSLEQLSGMTGLKADVAEHGSRLAELFTRKAGKDDVDGLATKLGGLSDTFSTELQRQSREIAADLSEARCGLESKLAGLGEQVGGKADAIILSELDATVRSEVERLAAIAKIKISKDALEARLATGRDAISL
jgi:hypothetical protein